jgi:diphthamide synthase (EF-2-diphthine--ammonia ligase)
MQRINRLARNHIRYHALYKSKPAEVVAHMAQRGLDSELRSAAVSHPEDLARDVRQILQQEQTNGFGAAIIMVPAALMTLGALGYLFMFAMAGS